MRWNKRRLDTISTVMTVLGLAVGLVGKLIDGKSQSIEMQEICEKAAKKEARQEAERYMLEAKALAETKPL